MNQQHYYAAYPAQGLSSAPAYDFLQATTAASAAGTAPVAATHLIDPLAAAAQAQAQAQAAAGGFAPAQAVYPGGHMLLTMVCLDPTMQQQQQQPQPQQPQIHCLQQHPSAAARTQYPPAATTAVSVPQLHLQQQQAQQPQYRTHHQPQQQQQQQHQQSKHSQSAHHRLPPSSSSSSSATSTVLRTSAASATAAAAAAAAASSSAHTQQSTTCSSASSAEGADAADDDCCDGDPADEDEDCPPLLLTPRLPPSPEAASSAAAAAAASTAAAATQASSTPLLPHPRNRHPAASKPPAAAAAAGGGSGSGSDALLSDPEETPLEVGMAVHVLPDPSAPVPRDGATSFRRYSGVGRLVARDASRCGGGGSGGGGWWCVEVSGWAESASGPDRGMVYSLPASSLRAAWRAAAAEPTAEEARAAHYAVAPEGEEAAAAEESFMAAHNADDLARILAGRLACPEFLQAMRRRPCNHNNWDNVRIVKGRIGLRCRACLAHWKVDIATVVKCPAFFMGYCPHGVLCPLPHIHRYKNRAKEQAKAQDKTSTEQAYNLHFHSKGTDAEENTLAATSESGPDSTDEDTRGSTVEATPTTC